MRISAHRFREVLNAGLPLSALLIAFTGLTFTAIKVVLMAGVLALNFRRTIRMIDWTFITLLFFAGVYCIAGGQSPDTEVPTYQIMTFPPAAYLLGKSFAASASEVREIRAGLFAIATALALWPAWVALGDIVARGFFAGNRSLYVESLGESFSATVMGGLLALAISQSAAIISGGFRQQKLFFMVAFVLAGVLLLLAIRLGSRTQIMIFVICLLYGALLNASGRFAMLKKVGAGLVAALLFAVAVELLPQFLDSDFGAYFRDRMDDGQYGTSSLGGRTQHWIYALESIAMHPKGWSLTDGGYAHNLWLDVARVSGWIGLVALLLFTAVHLRAVLRSLYRLGQCSARTALMLAVLSLNLLFMVEPIMDGFLYVFYAYCAVIGMFTGVQRNYAVITSRFQARTA